MFPVASLVLLTYLAVANAQQAGSVTAEVHPPLNVQECTASGSCTTTKLSVVLDSNWRWVHDARANQYTNCYDGNEWNTSLCPSGSTCAANCALEGADYVNTYGITASADSLSLKFVTGSNVGSRVYLMDSDNTNYKLFNLLNKEFTFTVDMSTLPCGLNGALYFVEMAKDGGLSKYPTNKAGAKYGTGYCDSQCPHDIKFINGVANVEGWNPSEGDPNSGAGTLGACCAEMDIWEANSQAAAYTPHPCTVTGPTSCTGTACGDGDDRYNGVCDKDGCDFNSWRQGDKTFLGPGLKVDTKKPFTVVTQFITNDKTATGTLTEIRRLYVQNGKVIANSVDTVGSPGADSITEKYCTEQKTKFGDTNSFKTKGGLASMGASFKRGMALVLSIWDDHAVNMLWLDSTAYPTTGNPSTPGVSRGPCSTTSGKPEDVEKNSPGATVKFSAIKTGPIGSTYAH